MTIQFTSSVCILSTDNQVIVFIFPIYFLVLCWGSTSNSNETMKFAQTTLFFITKFWGDKTYHVPLFKS